MSEHPESPNGVVHPSVQYEPTDLSLRAVLTFSTGLAVVLAVVVAGLFLMVWCSFGTPPPPESVRPWDFEAEKGPDASASYLPAKPELEAIDQNRARVGGRRRTRPIREQVRQEEDHLNGYGWVDEKKGTVYIPIEEAMKRLGGKPRAEAVQAGDEEEGLSAVSTSGRRTPGGRREEDTSTRSLALGWYGDAADRRDRVGAADRAGAGRDVHLRPAAERAGPAGAWRSATSRAAT